MQKCGRGLQLNHFMPATVYPGTAFQTALGSPALTFPPLPLQCSLRVSWQFGSLEVLRPSLVQLSYTYCT